MAHDKDNITVARRTSTRKAPTPWTRTSTITVTTFTHTRIRGRTSISTTKGMSTVQTIRPAAESKRRALSVERSLSALG